MSKSKKWSEQTLSEQSFTDIENGTEVVKTQCVLSVCTSGMELFREHFMQNGRQDALRIPFDFIVVGDKHCPIGQFYEMEYTIGGPQGLIYRALIQAANPCTDLRIIIGALINGNILPKDICPHKAFLRDDIDAIIVGACTDDDEHGISLYGSKTISGEPDQSYADFIKSEGSASFLYYRGDALKLTVDDGFDFQLPDIMVCGTSNVNNPAFARQREADLREMNELLDEALGIANDYNLSFFLLMNRGFSKGKMSFDCNLENGQMIEVLEAFIRSCGQQGHEEKSDALEFKELVSKILLLPIKAGAASTIDDSFDVVIDALAQLKEMGAVQLLNSKMN